MKRRITTLVLLLAFIAGTIMVLYPSLSEKRNALRQSQTIENYETQVSEMETDAHSAAWAAAQAYNRRLAESPDPFNPEEAELAQYHSLLNPDGDGAMGYVEIPALESKLAVYHGTEGRTLQRAVGHIVGSSLPVGGPDSHCVLSGHSGLSSARLFTGLDRLQLGDIFHLHVLGQTLSYEVDQIQVVLPDETEALAIQAGQDLCTLVTCTPYGVNSHRLFVRGHRVETAAGLAPRAVESTAMRINSYFVAACIALLPMLVLILIWLVQSRKR